MNTSKWKNGIIAAIFIIGFLFGLISLRYFLYLILPESITRFLLVPHVIYYFEPLINKMTFLMHSMSGVFLFTLGPLVFVSYRLNWKTKRYFFMSYCFFALFPLIWPVVFLFSAKGMSISYFLIITIELLWAFLLIKAYQFYKLRSQSQMMKYIVYHYCASLGAGLWRIIRAAIEIKVNGFAKLSVYILKSRAATPVLDPLNIWYDVSWYIALALGILLAKIIIYSDLLSVEDEISYNEQ